MSPVKTLVALIPALLLLHHARALRDVCKASYNTVINRKCLSFFASGIPISKPCCRFSPPCSLNHTLSAVWITELDTVRTTDKCEKACNEHIFKCTDKCLCLSKLSEVRSSKTCKCVREINGAVVNQQCLNACAKANQVCQKKCISTTRCPLKAVTKVKFRATYPGKCASICGPRIGSISPVCPFPVPAV